MRIEILLELINPTVSNKHYSGEFTGKHVDRPDDDSILGQGWYSVVRNDKKDPHMVKKNSKAARKQTDDGVENEDGFDYFAKALIDNNLIDSIPFFPRIYDIKKITDRNGDYIYKYQIEKLVPYHQLTTKEMQTVISRYTQNFDYEHNAKLLGSRATPQYVMHLWFAGELSNIVDGMKRKTIKDEDLLNALNILKNMASQIQDESDGKTGFPDIGASNLMYRRTKYGVQPVITDPFA